jgi:hypothetical protein
MHVWQDKKRAKVVREVGVHLDAWRGADSGRREALAADLERLVTGLYEYMGLEEKPGTSASGTAYQGTCQPTGQDPTRPTPVNPVAQLQEREANLLQGRQSQVRPVRVLLPGGWPQGMSGIIRAMAVGIESPRRRAARPPAVWMRRDWISPR